jgi:hypothetical protein
MSNLTFSSKGKDWVQEEWFRKNQGNDALDALLLVDQLNSMDLYYGEEHELAKQTGANLEELNIDFLKNYTLNKNNINFVLPNNIAVICEVNRDVFGILLKLNKISRSHKIDSVIIISPRNIDLDETINDTNVYLIKPNKNRFS